MMKHLKRLIVLGGLMCAGCSTFTTEFVDADGTNFKSRTMIAPFSKMDQDVAQMSYKWDQTQGEIGIGRDITGVDQTPQLEAARVAMDSIVKAIQAYVAMNTGVIPIPSLPKAPPIELEIPPPPREPSEVENE